MGKEKEHKVVGMIHVGCLSFTTPPILCSAPLQKCIPRVDAAAAWEELPANLFSQIAARYLHAVSNARRSGSFAMRNSTKASVIHVCVSSWGKVRWRQWVRIAACSRLVIECFCIYWWVWSKNLSACWFRLPVPFFVLSLILSRFNIVKHFLSHSLKKCYINNDLHGYI